MRKMAVNPFSRETLTSDI